MTAPALCSSCIHCWRYSSSYLGWRCRAPENVLTKANLVDGTVTYSYDTCMEARYTVGQCGADGNWFKQRDMSLSIHSNGTVKDRPGQIVPVTKAQLKNLKNITLEDLLK